VWGQNSGSIFGTKLIHKLVIVMDGQSSKDSAYGVDSIKVLEGTEEQQVKKVYII